MDNTRIDWSFISEVEGVRLRGYVPTDATGQPIGMSGVTVANGVDLGQATPDSLDRWGLPPALKAKLRPYCGAKGTAAVALLQGAPLALIPSEAGALSEAVQRSHLAALKTAYLRDAGRALDAQPPAAQTVIVSLAWQYGPNLAARAPRFWKAATAGDWQAVIRELRAFGDVYPTRRNKEAHYLEQATGGA